MKTKAQSISINTVIVAAIALIVLVVLIAIFSGRMRVIGTNVRDCRTQKGECMADCNSISLTEIPGTNCADNTDGNTHCCVKIFDMEEQDTEE